MTKIPLQPKYPQNFEKKKMSEIPPKPKKNDQIP